ncbi:MAG: amino acid permease [Pseudomonadota bacterium]
MTGKSFSPLAAAAVIVANMVGTGVFTSLGFQLVDIQSGFVLLMLWAVGGVIALCGAMSYAELGAALPRSGGEYNFLTRIYHPAMGFVSGWVSATIGFAAPTALAAITFATYLSSVFPDLSVRWPAAALVLALTLVHSTNRRNSGGTQLVFTVLKVLIILGFSALALVLVDQPQPLRFLPAAGDGALLTSGEFAVSLIYVAYAYTGWNAATYLSGELDNPQRYLPRVLAGGTIVVALLYVLLNWVFLRSAPIAEMTGQLEVGFIAAQHIFGQRGADAMGVVLALLLVSTVSAMIVAGPRVLQVIGQDFNAFRMLSICNRNGVPFVAICTQAAISLLFILTSTFESILVFAGFTLALNSLLTVLGLFVLRWRQPDLERPYRTTGYPVVPLVYLSLTGWTLLFVLSERPVEGLVGLALVGSGLGFYALTRWLDGRSADT